MNTTLFISVYLILFARCLSISIGTVKTARFTSFDRLNSNAVWITNQLSATQCLCTVLSNYHGVLLFNSYPNGSCQLFFSLPYTYTMEYNIHSTIILLSPLPPTQQAPCCSNLTWLMTRIINSPLPTVTLTYPTYLVIDDLDYLAVILYNDKLYRFNRTSMGSISATTVAASCWAMSYYNKQYFVGCGTGSSSKQYVLSTASLAVIQSISMPSGPRDVVFIRNGTVMIASLAGNNQLAFYNVTSSTTYTLTSTLSVSYAPYSLYAVNDSMLYVGSITTSEPTYTLTYNSISDHWIWGTLPKTVSSSNSANFQTTIDACGRIWISVKGYGIRIFDSTGTRSLYNWTLSNGLNGIALKRFDLYAADFGNNQVYGFRSGIDQCTS